MPTNNPPPIIFPIVTGIRLSIKKLLHVSECKASCDKPDSSTKVEFDFAIMP